MRPPTWKPYVYPCDLSRAFLTILDTPMKISFHSSNGVVRNGELKLYHECNAEEKRARHSYAQGTCSRACFLTRCIYYYGQGLSVGVWAIGPTERSRFYITDREQREKGALAVPRGAHSRTNVFLFSFFLFRRKTIAIRSWSWIRVRK